MRTNQPLSSTAHAPKSLQRNRDDFRSVSGGQSLEDTPWDTLEEGTSEESLDVGSEEGNEDGGDHE